VAIELAYINTKHPDFEEAKMIYRGMSDDLDGADYRKLANQNAAAAAAKVTH